MRGIIIGEIVNAYSLQENIEHLSLYLNTLNEKFYELNKKIDRISKGNFKQVNICMNKIGELSKNIEFIEEQSKTNLYLMEVDLEHKIGNLAGKVDKIESNLENITETLRKLKLE